MADAGEDVLKFVLLLEEHVDVLLKSQTILSKSKKKAAVDSIIPKWEEISKTKLSQVSLFKKINNLKTRAKLTLKSCKTLSEWQAKLLKIIEIDIDDEEDKANQIDFDGENSTYSQSIPQKSGTEILNELETDQTKLLNDDQLKRYVLLQQVHVLTLKRKRLEHLSNIDNGKAVAIDFIGFEDEIGGADPAVSKI